MDLVINVILVGKHEIDDVRKRRMRDVVEKPSRLFNGIGPKTLQECGDAQRVVETGHAPFRPDECRDASLMDGPQALHSLRGVELDQQRLGEPDLAIDRIVVENGGHRAASCAPVSNWISNPASPTL